MEALRSVRVRDPQYQPKVTCTPMWCVYVCWQGAGDPDNAFIMFFHHEINHAPMVFSRTKFSRRRRRYIRLVARDVDRFARLISAPARLALVLMSISG